jgi:hypothetical protein
MWVCIAMGRFSTTTPMNDKSEIPEEILVSLMNLHYDRAKISNGWHLAIESAVYIAGLGAVFLAWLPLGYPLVPLVLILVTSWVSSRSDTCKDIAETLKRQHECFQGFGIPLSPGQLAVLRMSVGKELSQRVAPLLREGVRFSSQRPLGPERVLENLCESAWFSAFLAGWCGRQLRAAFVGTIIVAFVMLVVVAMSVSGKPAGTVVAKSVSSSLAFVISVGILKGWFAFARFSRESVKAGEEAERLLKSSSIAASEAQRLLSEYQLARASGPLIPTWVWKKWRDRLNENWRGLKKPR